MGVCGNLELRLKYCLYISPSNCKQKLEGYKTARQAWWIEPLKMELARAPSPWYFFKGSREPRLEPH
jgi:hypothetical protein